jgi:hypothetical protein
MRIKWENILPLFLLILVIVLIVKSRLFKLFSRSIEVLLWHQDDPVYGIICLGIICMLILGIFRIISNRKH